MNLKDGGHLLSTCGPVIGKQLGYIFSAWFGCSRGRVCLVSIRPCNDSGRSNKPVAVIPQSFDKP
jgi:hypothetical protein